MVAWLLERRGLADGSQLPDIYHACAADRVDTEVEENGGQRGSGTGQDHVTAPAEKSSRSSMV